MNKNKNNQNNQPTPQCLAKRKKILPKLKHKCAQYLTEGGIKIPKEPESVVSGFVSIPIYK